MHAANIAMMALDEFVVREPLVKRDTMEVRRA